MVPKLVSGLILRNLSLSKYHRKGIHLTSIRDYRTIMSSRQQKQEPRIDNISLLSADEAKWSELQKIEWTDQAGQARIWEAASRKTRGSSGVDAVAIAPILLHPTKPAATLLIKQFRPPHGAYCIESPAGLVDQGETVEQAALRELTEETGFSGRIVSISPVVTGDPGLTTTNMQLAVVEVELAQDDELPEQHLEQGEFIERFVVSLNELYDRLMVFASQDNTIVDAKLFHYAAGLELAQRNTQRYGLSVSTT